MFWWRTKDIVFSGDFSITLIHYNKDKPTNELLDSLASSSYLPYIIECNRYTYRFRTLIDNILSNVILKDIISGNITATIAEHLSQFLLKFNNKLNVFETDW